jgi:hypothetical protein
MARCASLSFARFLSSCAAVNVDTLRVPALDGRLLDPVVECFPFDSEPEENISCGLTFETGIVW